MPSKKEKIIKEKQNAKRVKNRKYRTLIKNQFKEVEVYLEEKRTDENELKKLVTKTQKILDMAKSRKAIHKNRANDQKSKLYKNINELMRKI